MSTKVTVKGSLYQRGEKAARKAFEAVSDELFAAFQQSFMAKAWDWPRDLPTRKLDGATVGEKLKNYRDGKGVRAGSPRNIIDTANLRQSGYKDLTEPFSATFTWGADYATAVHEGARIRPWGNKRAALVTLPARPWTAAVMGRIQVAKIRPFPMQQRLKDVWLAKFKTGR